MRGLATGGYALSDTSDRPLVAVYLDDTPISIQGQTPDLRIYDLHWVEILRGPQGTLYGAGSMAGTVRFITVTKNLDVTAGVRYFNFNEKYFLFEGWVYGVVNHTPLTQHARQSSDGFNPRFNISYHVNDDVMVYAEAAKGFR